MTHAERIDAHIENCLQLWRERLRVRYFERHRSAKVTLKRIIAGDVPPDGTFVYVEKGTMPFGQIRNGRCVTKYGTYVLANQNWFIPASRIEAPPCGCSPCVIYRTCFVSEVAAAV